MSDQEKVMVLVIKGAISELPEEDQKAVGTMAKNIQEIVNSSQFGPIALALVGAELAAKES